jgi:histidyl-tRNA synthetase
LEDEEEMMQSSQSFRGMRDVLPGEVERRSHFLSTIRSVYAAHGFHEIETPIVDSLAILENSGGGENEKMIFKLLKRGEKLSLSEDMSPEDLVDGGLRFDLTVPLCRFYAENAVRLPRPFRSLQIGPVFRAERPQKGRYRQFLQADIDVIGDPTALSEIELLIASGHALHQLGLDNFEVRLNDRRALEQVLLKQGVTSHQLTGVMIALDKLDKTPPEQVVQEMMSRGVEHGIAEAILDVLGRATGQHVMDELANAGVDEAVLTNLAEIVSKVRGTIHGMGVRVDPLCVRGLGYYTSTVFEYSSPKWGSSIAGGGRYDSMLSRFGLDQTACGVSLGFERITALLATAEGTAAAQTRRNLYLLFDQSDQLSEALSAAREYRRSGFNVVLVSQRHGARSPMKRLASEAEELRRQGAQGEYWFVQLGTDAEPRLLMHG